MNSAASSHPYSFWLLSLNLGSSAGSLGTECHGVSASLSLYSLHLQPLQSQELGLMILKGPFQLRIVYDSLIMGERSQ